MTSLSQNWVEKTQICISSTTGGRKIKIRNYSNFGSKNFFWRKKFRTLKHLILWSSLWHHYDVNYQGRTFIQDEFFNFLKLQKFWITDSAGYITGELFSRITVFTEHHQWLIINAKAYYNRPELSNFDKIVGRREKQSHWLI